MIREQTNLFYTFLLHDMLNAEQIESDDVCVGKEEDNIEEDYVKTSSTVEEEQKRKTCLISI